MTEDEKAAKLIELFNPPREEQIRTTAAMMAVMTMSRIIHHQMAQTIKVFKNSMKEFSKEERERIEDMALSVLMEPIDKNVRKTILDMD